MELVNNRSYFISDSDVVLRTTNNHKSAARNHLLFGDWLKYLGEQKGAWAKVRCRGDTGWLPKSAFSDQRILEVNFVDIGQGDGCHIVTPDDQIVLIDAGIGDNMFRFLSWRYNLRGRKVAGVDGVTADTARVKLPMEIDHVVISHPDKDHYYGFQDLFDSRKVKIKNIYHNGAVERPISASDKLPGLHYYSSDDLGGYVKQDRSTAYLWDMVSSNTQLQALIRRHSGTRKNYLQTLEKAVKNNPAVKFTALSSASGYLDGFGPDSEVRFKVLGPVTESISHDNTTRQCLYRLGNEGVTKNGHSVILQLQIGELKVMLGGDLNTQSEDYLLQHYCQTELSVSELEKTVHHLHALGNQINPEQKQQLAEAEASLQAIITRARGVFQADITKACHHGSHHFSESFLMALNSTVTVISSGDNESYAHPRPDALGSFGKYGRGIRPLLFSTELARSTNEFTHIFKYFEQLKAYEKRIAEATSESRKKQLEKQMQEKKDSNVAVYGMITLRTDGNKAILAQKLEAPGGKDNKWDIHELVFNQNNNQFEYQVAAKGH